MAQNEIGEVRLAGGGGSSAMPHKSNPVRAEALVALARFNAALLGAHHQALVHENERSGAAWTLEWLVPPQIVAVDRRGTAACRTLCARGCNSSNRAERVLNVEDAGRFGSNTAGRQIRGPASRRLHDNISPPRQNT